MLRISIVAAVALAVAGRLRWATVAIAALLFAIGIRYQIAGKYGFQFHGGLWKYPEAAANFILEHKLQGRIFNTYNQGGYLIWKLWPQQQVFFDGRALNEKVFEDATRIAMYADASDGKSSEQLLKDYGIDIILMDGFDSTSGTAFFLPAALADPSLKEWKLVFRDMHDVIYMRNPPPGVPVLPSLDALDALEEQCALWVRHNKPLCSRGMLDIFIRVGDRVRSDKWNAVYQQYRYAEKQFTVVPR